MTRNTRIPKLCKRRSPSTGKTLAYATFNGRTVSFGQDGPQARQEFDAFLASWLAAGRVLPEDEAPPPAPLSVGELFDRYLAHLEEQKSGTRWMQTWRSKVVLSFRPARDLFDLFPAESFSPRSLQSVRRSMIDAGTICRREINARIRVIRKAFRWAVAEEIVPPSVSHGLGAVDSLRRGEYGTHEGKKIEPVPWKDVEPLLPHLSRQVRALVLLMWWSGARPSELFGLRPCDLDRSGAAWTVELAEHKNADKGKRRALFFGPEAQQVLGPFLLRRSVEEPLFSPKEAVDDLAKARREKRKTPLWKSHVRRYEREKAARDRNKVGGTYNHSSFRIAVQRGIKAANVERAMKELPPIPRWHPYQLRHAAATRIRKECGGLEAVRVLLGHSSATMSEVYAEADLEVARKVMEKAG